MSLTSFDVSTALSGLADADAEDELEALGAGLLSLACSLLLLPHPAKTNVKAMIAEIKVMNILDLAIEILLNDE
jgi:hypothetical protein